MRCVRKSVFLHAFMCMSLAVNIFMHILCVCTFPFEWGLLAGFECILPRIFNFVQTAPFDCQCWQAGILLNFKRVHLLMSPFLTLFSLPHKKQKSRVLLLIVFLLYCW